MNSACHRREPSPLIPLDENRPSGAGWRQYARSLRRKSVETLGKWESGAVARELHDARGQGARPLQRCAPNWRVSKTTVWEQSLSAGSPGGIPSEIPLTWRQCSFPRPRRDGCRASSSQDFLLGSDRRASLREVNVDDLHGEDVKVRDDGGSLAVIDSTIRRQPQRPTEPYAADRVTVRRRKSH